MLVLSRRVGEKLRIGDQIEVVVIEVKGDTVRLGVKAPRGVAIHREEIYQAIQAENRAAAEAKASAADMLALMQKAKENGKEEKEE
jgi:carbon storage regulator